MQSNKDVVTDISGVLKQFQSAASSLPTSAVRKRQISADPEYELESSSHAIIRTQEKQDFDIKEEMDFDEEYSLALLKHSENENYGAMQLYTSFEQQKSQQIRECLVKKRKEKRERTNKRNEESFTLLSSYGLFAKSLFTTFKENTLKTNYQTARNTIENDGNMIYNTIFGTRNSAANDNASFKKNSRKRSFNFGDKENNFTDSENNENGAKKPHRDYSNSQLKIQKQNLRTCPKCGSKLVQRTAQKGQYAGKIFYGCSNFPKCRFTINDIQT